jgi:hypothetical protein
MNKKELLEKFEEIKSSGLNAFISVNDVINLVSSLKEPNTTLSADDISVLVDSIASKIASEGENLIYDYDLELSHREIELTGIDFDNNELEKVIEEAITEFLESED